MEAEGLRMLFAIMSELLLVRHNIPLTGSAKTDFKIVLSRWRHRGWGGGGHAYLRTARCGGGVTNHLQFLVWNEAPLDEVKRLYLWRWMIKVLFIILSAQWVFSWVKFFPLLPPPPSFFHSGNYSGLVYISLIWMAPFHARGFQLMSGHHGLSIHIRAVTWEIAKRLY